MMPVSPAVAKQLQQLETIYTVLRCNSITLSKTESAKIVGSRGLLEKLVATGKIRRQDSENMQGGWRCLAEDVLRYADFRN